MCGRYLFDPMTGELDEYWQIIADVAKKQEKYKEQEIATGEVFPSNNVLTLGANKNNEVVPGVTKWGFEGFKKGQLFINARSESVEEKKTFSKHFRERRIVFPMNGFYEWDSDKKKFLFTGNNEVIYVAGFYRIHENVAESIIMTTEPNAAVSPIHDRMPLIIEKSDIDKWVLDLDFAREYLKRDMDKFENLKIKSA
ncbi:SOS response-associated peptidase family protein [Enterococcus avium]|uniref:SOS response-associated peptidase family protein n=1 Tax=Enterococcus avium TaxID=33945 RepID=UPI00288F47D7|nr:SOS response-associated peptidase family protein [Enterococcus avium]MBN2919135.1 SOS response-associated peptidase family protein [Lactobacillus sp.]MDT2481136.1 SOS response-associated peptidase family protein [Enterococcus avium]